MDKDGKFYSGFAAIVGRPNVGKSTLMNAMVGEKVAIVSSKPQTTRNRIMGVSTGENWQLVFLDTPGMHEPRTKLGEYMVKSIHDAMEGIDVLIVVLAINEIGKQDRAIVEQMAATNVPKVLVLNKTDTVPENVIFVSESGVKGAEDVAALKEIGADAVLVGETLMRAEDKKAKLSELRG